MKTNKTVALLATLFILATPSTQTVGWEWITKNPKTSFVVGAIAAAGTFLLKKYQNYREQQEIAQEYSAQALENQLRTEQQTQTSSTFILRDNLELAQECMNFISQYFPHDYSTDEHHKKLIDGYMDNITNLINKGANPYVICMEKPSDPFGKRTESAYSLMTQHVWGLKDDAFIKKMIAILEKSKHTKPN